MRLIGLDPGLQRTGWGVIESDGNHLSFIGAGVVATNSRDDLASRLNALFDGLSGVLEMHKPLEAAVEETFVNKNPSSTLKLGQARGVVLLVPARLGVGVFEYTPNLVKKSIVGSGHAAKGQVQMMVATLLPGADVSQEDAADALAVAICHAHHRQTQTIVERTASR